MTDPIIEIDEDRPSTRYRGTVNHHTAEGQLIIEELRQGIRAWNKEWPRKFYVKLQGRLGKNNPNAFKYSKNAKRPWTWAHQTFGPHNHRTIRLEDAAYVDMYVYERR